MILEHLKQVLVNGRTKKLGLHDFSTTFSRLNVKEPEELAQFLISQIISSQTLEEVETAVRSRFELLRTTRALSVFQEIQQGLGNRFELMFAQLQPHLKDVKHAIDYGCGAGVLTQMLHDRLHMGIEGVDVRDFRASNVTVPIRCFDGHHVSVTDGHFDCAVLTNVIHHEAQNDRLLQELNRIARRKLVIIETVPEGQNDEEVKADWGRMLLNDVLWNRFFNYANIPCPGTYETPQKWIHRFHELGWDCTHSEDLGFDQPTIQDRHHLLVFEK